MMTLTVTRVDLEARETIGVGYGRTDDGREVCFGGDWRPMLHLREALDAGEHPRATIEQWQLLSIHNEGETAE